MIKKSAIAALLAALLPLQSFARDYHVEAIIFTNPVSDNAQTIAWDEKSPRNIRAQNRLDTLYRQAVEATKVREEAALLDAQEKLTAAPEPTEPAEPVDDAEKPPIETHIAFELVELLDIQDKLAENPDYEILQTLSWEQSEADYKTSPLINTLTPHMKGVIRIYAPNLLFAEVNLTYVPEEVFEEALEEELGDQTNEPVAEITPGFDTSYASISYSDGFMIQELPEPVIARYFMDEQRKLKLNEIHYFDHSRFGVILSVMPVEEAEPETS